MGPTSPEAETRRPLTPRQAEVLAAIVEHLRTHGFAPTLREIGAAMVRDAEKMAAHRHTVSVLALLDGRKPAVVQPGEKRPTRGTEHTVGLARDAGLTVDAQTWTPKGATT